MLDGYFLDNRRHANERSPGGLDAKMFNIDERFLRIGVTDVQPVDIQSERVRIKAYLAHRDRALDLRCDWSGENMPQQRRYCEETRQAVNHNDNYNRDTDIARAARAPERESASGPCFCMLGNGPKDVHPRYPQSGIRQL
ncbi:MAG TPA: hypothetical protein VMV27_00725 [Candidatus Binataceae bacterium]|nr:hypothetical protein [Candidatus Binataceae bacterium]